MLQMVHDVMKSRGQKKNLSKVSLENDKIIWRAPVELYFYQRIIQFAPPKFSISVNFPRSNKEKRKELRDQTARN